MQKQKTKLDVLFAHSRRHGEDGGETAVVAGGYQQEHDVQPVDQVSDRVHFDQLVAGRLHHQEPEGAQNGVRFRREPPVVPLLTLRSCQKTSV